jgi:hypothetical protein
MAVAYNKYNVISNLRQLRVCIVNSHVYVKWEHCEDMTEGEARLLLGHEAEGMTDDQIKVILDDLRVMANTLLDQMEAAAKADPEGFRWLLHAHRTGEAE